MLNDIKHAAAEAGLEVHPGKTNVLSNATRGTSMPKDPRVMGDGTSVGIASCSGSVKYLGKLWASTGFNVWKSTIASGTLGQILCRITRNSLTGSAR